MTEHKAYVEPYNPDSSSPSVDILNRHDLWSAIPSVLSSELLMWDELSDELWRRESMWEWEGKGIGRHDETQQ